MYPRLNKYIGTWMVDYVNIQLFLSILYTPN